MESTIRSPKKSSTLLYVLLFLLLLLIGYFAYNVITQGDKGGTKDVKNEAKDEGSEKGSGGEVVDDDTDGEIDEEVVDTGSMSLSDFKSTSQSVGSMSEIAGSFYTLVSLNNSAKSGYHLFEFTLSGKESGSPQPHATATYVPSLGAVRVDLRGVTTDNSGIGYQKSLDINRDGVVKIYHNVSADQTQELYDIGVVSQTPFLLSIKEVGFGTDVWVLSLGVKYPGVSENQAKLDLGSDVFSKEIQTIAGANRVDGARVSSYSYSASAGVLRVVFEVRGSDTLPIPSVKAEYVDGLLVMRFTDIVSDAIAKMPASQSMSGGITMVWEMDGSSASKYTFEGATKEFKLYGSTNPNQVVLEIRL